MTKWALVTGACAGIGKEFCEQLAARGDNVVLVARRADRLEELKAHLEKRYRVHAEVLAADLANADDLKRVAERVAQASDPIEVLVNNAGFGLKTAFLDTDVEKEIASVDVMVKAVVVLSHAAGRAMRERGGARSPTSRRSRGSWRAAPTRRRSRMSPCSASRSPASSRAPASR